MLIWKELYCSFYKTVIWPAFTLFVVSWQPTVWLHSVCICIHFLITKPSRGADLPARCERSQPEMPACSRINQDGYLMTGLNCLWRAFSWEHIFILCLLNTYLSAYLPLQQFLPHSLTVLHSLFFFSFFLAHVPGSCWWGKNSRTLWQLTPAFLPDSSLCSSCSAQETLPWAWKGVWVQWTVKKTFGVSFCWLRKPLYRG